MAMEIFEQTKPLHNLVEKWSVLKRLPSLEEKNCSILDLATGEGRFARSYREAGHKGRILGVDLSHEQIRQAKDHPSQAEYRIEYLQHNCLAPLPEEEMFDVVTAHYLLCFATDRFLLQDFCRSAYHSLKKGGTFLALNDNENQIATSAELYKKYGFMKQCRDPKALWTAMDEKQYPEGTEITWNIFEPVFWETKLWIWNKETYFQCLEQAGFSEIEYLPLLLPNDFDSEKRNFLSDFLEHPPIVLIKARKI